jgi:hypothetical protein
MKVTKDKIECSIQEWDCYNTWNRKTPQDVVETINEEILNILSTSHSPVWAQKRIYNYLDQYKEYGFRDSECEQTATQIINEYYNSTIDRWEAYHDEWKKLGLM